MFELIEKSPPVNVQESEYKRLLGYPANHVLDGRPRELVESTRDWYSRNGRPWTYAREIGALEFKDEKLRIAGNEFSSKLLSDQFAAAKAHSSVLAAVSAGPECEERARQLWLESKPDEYFFMEVFGSAVVEHLVTVAGGVICGWADRNNMAVLPRYSPGYSGWDIADQGKLWNLIRQDNGCAVVGKIDVLETGMLRPKKSLLAVFGVTRDLEQARRFASLVPCECCSLPGCQYRRTPYKHALPNMEDVRRLQDSGLPDDKTGMTRPPALASNAKYITNARAVQKWSQERLHLNSLPDGSIEAHFRYEGTTCSNMGRPLEFDYRVKLAAGNDHYRILEASCAPSPEDIGNAYQCEYLNDAKSLMRSIATEKPLLGQPLSEVLNWQRAFNPSGCFCDSERRNHKWGLVFEVIHFALAQREKDAKA